MTSLDVHTGEIIESAQEGVMILQDSPMSLQTKGEIDTQISTAKRYPRRWSHAKAEALSMATSDEETAGSCLYALPRGANPIQGPSIRLAEIMLTAWGNIRADSRIIEIGDKTVTAEAMCWDLEKNVAIRITASRSILDKRGNRYKEDMVNVTCQAAISVALRNAIFKVIPRSYINQVYQHCIKVATGDAQTLGVKRVKMVDAIVKMGVKAERVFAAADANTIEDIDLPRVGLLLGLYNAVKNGEVNIDTAFPEVRVDGEEQPKGDKAEKLATAMQPNLDALRQKAKEAEAKTPPPSEKK